MRPCYSRRNVKGHSGGFTLIELLVCLFILGVLISLIAPSLAAARSRSATLQCQINIRSTHQIVALYSNEYRDYFPFAGLASHSLFFHPQDVPINHDIGGRFGLSAGLWSVLFPQHWAGRIWSRSLRCPKQPDFDPAIPAGVPLDARAEPLPLYWLSSSLWLDPSTLRSTDQPIATILPKPNTMSDILYPSLKVVLFEQATLCVNSAESRAWTVIRQSPYSLSSISLADGSVRQFIRMDALPAAAQGMPFDRTLHGVRGRDLP